MTKEELALEVIARLKKEYPDAGMETACECPSCSAMYRCKS